jgi:hypothetical protein
MIFRRVAWRESAPDGFSSVANAIATASGAGHTVARELLVSWRLRVLLVE